MAERITFSSIEKTSWQKLMRRVDPAKIFFTVSGITVIIILLGIFVLLIRNSVPFFSKIPILDFLLGDRWNPTSEIKVGYGILPLVVSSGFVTAGAMIISIPIGIGAALYLSEVAAYKVREVLKPVIEILASIPSVVVGFLGLTLLGPVIATLTGKTNGLNAINGSILLAIMALPTIISLSEDALRSVPNSFREASFALGSNHWETMTRITLPAARSGIFAAVMLGLGRAIGETMTVLMVCGNALQMPTSFTDSVRTLTATIAIELGEVPDRSQHYFALFAVGLILFILTFIINLVADQVMRRQHNIATGNVSSRVKKKEA